VGTPAVFLTSSDSCVTLSCTLPYDQDLKEHQKTKEAEFARTHASVFKKLSIVELSIFILLGLWDKLADHYVDYSGNASICVSFTYYRPSHNLCGYNAHREPPFV
jgi:hypothetical protein